MEAGPKEQISIAGVSKRVVPIDPKDIPTPERFAFNLLPTFKMLVVFCIGVAVGTSANFVKLTDIQQKLEEAQKIARSVNLKTGVPTIDTVVNTLTKEPRLDLRKLPIGDNKVSKSAKKGYIFACNQEALGKAAFASGPWVNIINGTWDVTRKTTVDGNISWDFAQNIKADVNTRIIAGSGLPIHTSGLFPIATSDDAYTYDKNPNSIGEQQITVALPKNPTILRVPECVNGGPIGYMLSGAALFNGFDAQNRDALAHEIQDTCGGHPERTGQYHYHGYSSCAEKNGQKNNTSTLLGYAVDGFGIYNDTEANKQLITEDLDECHGHIHTTTWDNEQKEIYHYHITRDFPYSIGCFKGKKVQQKINPLPGQNDTNNNPNLKPRPL
jgi:hypothetical protein